MFGVVDEGGEAPSPGFLFLGADDPPDRGLPVRRRLRFEERPRFPVGSELTGLRAVEADSILLERVLIRARDVSLVERADRRARRSAARSVKRAMPLALRARRGVKRIV